MTSPPRRRRTVDRLVAAAIAVVLVVVGVVLYLTSDIRATSADTGPLVPVPSAADTAPTSLTQRWTVPTDPALGAVASPSGVVVTTDAHTVTARDAMTGDVRWSYGRSNENLCAVGSGDIDGLDVNIGAGVRGIATVYEKNGFCSQVTTLDPVTGARSKVRTSPNQAGGQLVIGGPYAGWMGHDLVEVWRNDLVRTIQYGVQPNPPNPNTSHLGCTFTDMALATNQLATLEHCPAQGSHARIVLNFADPGAAPGHPNGWDVFKHDPRMDVDTGSDSARIVGLSADRVAVLVASPLPAVVLYDAAGSQISRTPVDIPAAEITAAAGTGVTPSVHNQTQTISLIGSHLVAVSDVQIQTAAPATAFTTLLPTSSSGAASSAAPQVSVDSLRVDWTIGSALGLPALINQQALIPVAGGLSVVNVATGPTALGSASGRVITVNRSGYAGRVDAAAVGKLVVETRGSLVVVLS